MGVDTKDLTLDEILASHKDNLILEIKRMERVLSYLERAQGLGNPLIKEEVIKEYERLKEDIRKYL